MTNDQTPIYTETLIDSALFEQVPYVSQDSEAAMWAAWDAEMDDLYGDPDPRNW